MFGGTMQGSAGDRGAPGWDEGNNRQPGVWRRARGFRREGVTAAAFRGAGAWGAVLLALVSGLLAPAAAADERHYVHHESVPVLANNVFPSHNPAETYRYFSLPFCRGPEGSSKETQHQRFGEVLLGDRKVSTGYPITFKDQTSWHKCGDAVLTPEQLQAFQEAIKDYYFFEFFIDGLSVQGPIGSEVTDPNPTISNIWGSGTKILLYNHMSFEIGYNGDQIVSAKVEWQDHSTPEPDKAYVDISDASKPMDISWTYSVTWVEDATPYSARVTKSGLFPTEALEIHWLSIINSFVLVVILTVFLAIILLRVIRLDFTRYVDVDEDDISEEDSGWKLIHGDVFRFPRHLSLFAALNGAGAQLCLVMLSLLVCALFGVFRATRRGSILTCAFVLYSMTAWVGGLMSARLYRQLGGRQWVWNSVLASLIIPGPLFIVFSIVNSIAWYQSSTAAIPFFLVLVIVAMFLFITFPLTVIGAIIGRNTASDFEAPCRTTRVPRQVPKDIPWYRHHLAHMFMSGFLPFTAIYIELHYIFASVWGHQIYTMFGILILAFILLVVVCSFITVALVYFQLSREDHRWWWRSFCSGGSTGLFVFAFSFFYFRHSGMDGLLQISFYFGYTAMVSYAFFVMLGYVGFSSSLMFVKHIYSVVKCD